MAISHLIVLTIMLEKEMDRFNELRFEETVEDYGTELEESQANIDYLNDAINQLQE